MGISLRTANSLTCSSFWVCEGQRWEYQRIHSFLWSLIIYLFKIFFFYWRSPGGGLGNPLQYSCLENPTDRGAWWAIVHRVTKSRTWLQGFSTQHIVALQCCVSFFCTAKWINYMCTYILSFLRSPQSTEVTTERQIEFPMLYRRFSLVIYFIHSSEHMSVPIWHIYVSLNPFHTPLPPWYP